MNIEKVKNYNQVALAILVTAGVLMALVGLISLIFLMITEVFGSFNRTSNYNQTNSYSTESIVSNSDEATYNKLITCSFPEIIDTTNQIYLIPVHQSTQDELTNNFTRKLSFSESKKIYDDTYNSGYVDKAYINMMVYDAKTGTRDIIFNKKLLIGQYGTQIFNDEVFLLMEIVLSDTNKDGTLSLDDQTSLFIYSTKTKQLREIKYADKSVLYFSNIPKSKDFLVKFGVDLLKRPENKTNTDMSVVCKYIYDQDKLVVVYDEKVQNELKVISDKK